MASGVTERNQDGEALALINRMCPMVDPQYDGSITTWQKARHRNYQEGGGGKSLRVCPRKRRHVSGPLLTPLLPDCPKVSSFTHRILLYDVLLCH